MLGLTADWRQSWAKAMWELDMQKFALMVTKVESAMFRRYQDIADSPDHVEERMQMDDALDDLHAVKVERLKWRPA